MTEQRPNIGVKRRDADKVKNIPIKVLHTNARILKKPNWLKVRIPSNTQEIKRIKSILRSRNLHSVCEEANCPNLPECFGHGTATFMIAGDICTRRCPFCDVANGRPLPLDPDEPKKLAEAVKEMNLRYVVITSVNRDDLKDGGAAHFVKCIEEIRKYSPLVKVEVLVPDFRGCEKLAISLFTKCPPDVFNHNIENVPRFYKHVRPGANYEKSLMLLYDFKKNVPSVPTKSGLMLGIGETDEEILQVMRDLRDHDVEMLTLGQYLPPSAHHWPLARYVTPEQFADLKEKAIKMGFCKVASGPLVRSSYQADLQAKGMEVS